MTSKSTHYLTRRGEVYQLRIPVPQHLQGKLHRKEIRRSLKTRDLQIARRKVFRAVLLFDDICHNITMTNRISKAQSHEIVGAFHELLNQAHTPTPPMMERYCPVEANHEAFAASQYAHNFSERLNANKLSIYDESLMNSALSKLGINLRHYPQARQGEILEGISQAYFEHAELVANGTDCSTESQVNTSDFNPYTELSLIAISPTKSNSSLEEPLEASDNQLGKLIEEYISNGTKYGHTSSGPWGDTSIAVNQKVLRWFEELVGSQTDVRNIAQQHGRAFRDTLRQLKKGTPGGANLGASLTSNPKRAISAATAGNLFGYLKTFFGWLESEGYCQTKPT